MNAAVSFFKSIFAPSDVMAERLKHAEAYAETLKAMYERENREFTDTKNMLWHSNICYKCGGVLGLRANAVKQCNACANCP